MATSVIAIRHVCHSPAHAFATVEIETPRKLVRGDVFVRRLGERDNIYIVLITSELELGISVLELGELSDTVAMRAAVAATRAVVPKSGVEYTATKRSDFVYLVVLEPSKQRTAEITNLLNSCGVV